MSCIQVIQESNACIENYLYKPYFFISLFSRLVPPIMSLTRLGALPLDSRRSRLFLLFVLLFPFISISSYLSAASIFEGNVVKIADGDTITVLDSDKVQHRVRIAGIDAPEKKQAFGNASRKRLGELVVRKEVRVEFDKHDRYGRIVGKVLVKPPDSSRRSGYLVRNFGEGPLISVGEKSRYGPGAFAERGGTEWGQRKESVVLRVIIVGVPSVAISFPFWPPSIFPIGRTTASSKP